MGGSWRVKVNRGNLKIVQAQLKALANSKIQLGCRAGQHPDSTLSYSALMTIHEDGATIQNGFGRGIRIIIPARSPFRKTVRNDQIKAQASAELTGLIRVNTTPKGLNVKKVLEGIGEFWRSAVVETITQGLSPALAASTLAMRAKKGVGGNLPLYAGTHELANSIDFATKVGK